MNEIVIPLNLPTTSKIEEQLELVAHQCGKVLSELRKPKSFNIVVKHKSIDDLMPVETPQKSCDLKSIIYKGII